MHLNRLSAVCLLCTVALPPSPATCSAAAEVSAPENSGRGNPDRQEIWRTADMDGVNCLFLLSRLLDKDVRHDHLRQLLAPARERTSFWCLVDVARRVGLHAQLVKCRPEDLREVELPAIAFMENERGAGGKYVLLFGSPAQTADDVYRVVEGGTLFMRDCTIDDFRRHWSGYLLVPNKHMRRHTAHLVWIVPIALLAWKLILRWYRTPSLQQM